MRVLLICALLSDFNFWLSVLSEKSSSEFLVFIIGFDIESDEVNNLFLLESGLIFI